MASRAARVELREALTQIAEIRLQMARTQVFRGYRALPVAFSGLLAISAAFVQFVWINDPLQNLAAYLTLWIGAAVVSAVAAGVEMVIRSHSHGTALTREITWLAVGQFLPCLAAGGGVTAVLARGAPEAVWVRPGVWQLRFSCCI